MRSVPRVVIDTNVFISGILKAKSAPGMILQALSEPDSLELLLSEQIFNEYNEVIRRQKFGLNEDTINTALSLILEIADIVLPEKEFNVLPDPDDNRFLECAVEGRADFLVTGNRKHFPFSEFYEVKIVSPSELIKILRQDEPEHQ